MTLLLLCCGVAALALPGLRPRALLESSPRSFVRLAVISVVVGIGGIVGALVLSASVGGLHLWLGMSTTPVDHLAPEGTAGAVAATAALAWTCTRSAVLVTRVRRTRRTARAEGWLGEHEVLDGVDVVMLPTEAPVAYSVPGRRPQIVISRGLRQQVDDELLRFVVDHERAHLRARHGVVVLLAALVETAFGFVPGSTRSALALRLAIERAADEDAAGGEEGRRRQLAHGIAHFGARLRPACGGDLVHFRSRTLAAHTETSSPQVAVAAAGVVILALAGLASTVHVTGDLAPYLALL